MQKLETYSSVIEYVDIEETNNSLIAMNRKYLENKTYKYNYCEIDPSTIFSIYTNIIPFFDHNPYPRNAFGCQQGKQAIGIYARLDSKDRGGGSTCHGRCERDADKTGGHNLDNDRRCTQTI